MDDFFAYIRSVKNRLKIVLLSLLIGLYSFVICQPIVLAKHAELDVRLVNEQQNHAINFSNRAVNLIAPFMQIVPVVEAVRSIQPIASLYLLGHKVNPITYLNRQLIAEGEQFRKNCLNRLIRVRKSDLIFPFHYDW
jgi:hypothetical protein